MPDAATIDPPPAAPAAHPGAITIDLGNLGKKPKPATSVEVTPKATEATPEVDKAAADAKAAEAAVAAAAETAKKSGGDKEENMANLRKAREAAEQARKALEEEHNKLKTEFEAFKTKAPELPEEVKSRLTAAEQLEKEMQEMRQRVREVDLSRDPEFQAKYNRPIMERITAMGQTALAAGVSEADWKNAVANWDETQFAEWSEGMNPVQKVKFIGAWTAAVDLNQQQQAELKNADQSWQELQKRRQAEAENQQKQVFTQNEQLARSVLAETIKPETLKEYEDLGPSAEALLLKAARYEIPAKEVFQQLAANQVLARVTVKQKSRIDELEAALVERDKKISEQDAFIANQAGAVPRGDAAGASGATGKTGPIWQNIVVKTPG